MHGCYTTIRSLKFDVHTMAFNVFFSYKTAFKQFSTITFAKDGKSTCGSRFKAFFPSLVLPPLLKSLKAIPVYRKDASAYKTLVKSNEFLQNGQSVLLFPDVDYKADINSLSEIYKGFLLLEKLYFKKTNSHLTFVPLYIDDKQKKIYQKEPVVFEDGDFNAQLDKVAEKIKNAINNIEN